MGNDLTPPSGSAPPSGAKAALRSATRTPSRPGKGEDESFLQQSAGRGERSFVVSIIPQLSGVGGPASFRGRLVQGLAELGVQVCSDPLDPSVSAVLVIGGTKRMDLILRARMKGKRIVQRLNGMNWLHRKVNTGRKHWLRSEVNNWILSTIRKRMADAVIYQSQFARNWWQTVYGGVSAPGKVVYNGVDLSQFQPNGREDRPEERYRVLMVEGHVAGGYEHGLENGVRLVQELNRSLPAPVELLVAGEVAPELRAQWEAEAGELVRWAGIVPREQIPALDRSAHVLFSADLNAACPNSVVEALACGLPVVSFATGSLPELISSDAGLVVPYGSNYWNLEKPDIDGLAAAAARIFNEQDHFRASARNRAEEEFGLDRMAAGYLAVLANGNA